MSILKITFFQVGRKVKFTPFLFDYSYKIPYITYMNIEKYKSVAIHKDTYDKIKPMAKKGYMTINNFIRMLVDKEHAKEQESKKEVNGVSD